MSDFLSKTPRGDSALCRQALRSLGLRGLGPREKKSIMRRTRQSDTARGGTPWEEGGTMHAHPGISRRHVLGLAMAVGGLAMAGDVRRVWAQAAGGKVALDVRHPDLHTLIAPEAPLTRIAGGLGFTEGPVWRGTGLPFSDIPNKRIVRWRRLPEGPELTTYATGSSNGLTLDRHGQVLAARPRRRPLTRRARDT